MISVIIPIYNSEKYLKTCLSSVRDQSFKDFEVLMIDDGSTDRSAAICKEFALADDRFHYYYKENGGSGSARNRGIEAASGDYIAFIDSDDYIEADYFASLTAPLNEQAYDLVQCGMYIRKGEKATSLSPADTAYTGPEFAEAALKRQFPIFLFITTTTKLYRRAILVENQIRFDEDVTVSEDCLFNTQLLPLIQEAKQLSWSGYNYIQDNSTLTKTKSSYQKVFQSIKVGIITAGIRNDVIQQYGLENDPDIIKGFHTAICIIYLSNAHEIECGGFTKEEKKKLYDSYFSVMNYPVERAINEYQGTDRKIIEASVKKDATSISKIYKLRELKSKVKFW